MGYEKRWFRVNEKKQLKDGNDFVPLKTKLKSENVQRCTLNIKALCCKLHRKICSGNWNSTKIGRIVDIKIEAIFRCL